MSTENIGEFRAERDARQNLKARQIVSEILNFGVNDRMILLIIDCLAMNLERVEHMKAISNCIRNLDDAEISLLDRVEEDAKVGYISGEEADSLQDEED